MLQPIKTLSDTPKTVLNRVAGDCTCQSVFLDHLPFTWAQQLDGLESHGLAGNRQLLERNLGVAPFAYGVMNASPQTTDRISGPKTLGEGCSRHRDGGGHGGSTG